MSPLFCSSLNTWTPAEQHHLDQCLPRNIICPKNNLPYMSIAVSQMLIAYKSTLENSAMSISSKEKTTLAAPSLHKQVIPNKGSHLHHVHRIVCNFATTLLNSRYAFYTVQKYRA
ncbi:hypothetical protein SUGI_0299380 [Cryptomeria japonica]|nr:hypothetical protein SUGI_0299380 [Cryptomeria japonica]